MGNKLNENYERKFERYSEGNKFTYNPWVDYGAKQWTPYFDNLETPRPKPTGLSTSGRPRRALHKDDGLTGQWAPFQDGEKWGTFVGDNGPLFTAHQGEFIFAEEPLSETDELEILTLPFFKR